MQDHEILERMQDLLHSWSSKTKQEEGREEGKGEWGETREGRVGREEGKGEWGERRENFKYM